MNKTRNIWGEPVGYAQDVIDVLHQPVRNLFPQSETNRLHYNRAEHYDSYLLTLPEVKQEYLMLRAGFPKTRPKWRGEPPLGLVGSTSVGVTVAEMAFVMSRHFYVLRSMFDDSAKWWVENAETYRSAVEDNSLLAWLSMRNVNFFNWQSVDLNEFMEHAVQIGSFERAAAASNNLRRNGSRPSFDDFLKAAYGIDGDLYSAVLDLA